MTDIRIRPGHAKGTVKAPPSKSQLHRSLIAAALCGEESRIRIPGWQESFPFSDDITATIECLRALGCRIQITQDELIVRGNRNEKLIKEPLILPVHASGSTLRFLIPLALSLGRPVRFTGDRTLFERPLTVYEDLCLRYGFPFQVSQDDHGAYLDVCGPKRTEISAHSEPAPESPRVSPNIEPMSITIQGNISSQFTTGLLLALPLFPGGGRIELIPPVVSRPYIEMTRQVLDQFGIQTFWEKDTDHERILIPAGQKYQNTNITIEGDESQAAFLKAIPLLDPMSEVIATGLNPDTVQGDRAFISLADKLQHQLPVDLSDTPDLGPILFAVAAAGSGGSFTGTARLQDKESDRVQVMAEELAKFGIQSRTGPDRFTVLPGKLRAPDEPLTGHGDHRVVMALAILLIKTGGVIRGAEAISKSDPMFFDRLKALGIQIEEERNTL